MIHSRRAGHIVRVKDLDGKRVTSGRGEGESTLNELHCARIGNSLANLPHCAHCICGLYVSFPQLLRLIKIKVKNHRQLRVEGAGGERERGEEEDLLGIAGKVIGFQVELEVEWEDGSS